MNRKEVIASCVFHTFGCLIVGAFSYYFYQEKQFKLAMFQAFMAGVLVNSFLFYLTHLYWRVKREKFEKELKEMDDRHENEKIELEKLNNELADLNKLNDEMIEHEKEKANEQ